MAALILFTTLCLTLLSGYPVALVLAGVSLAGATAGIVFGYFDTGFLIAVPSRIFGIMNNTTPLAVPLFVFPFHLFLGWVSLDYFRESWPVMERSTESDGLPALSILKALMPLIPLTLMLQGSAEICRGVAHSDPPEAADQLPPLT